MSCGELLASVKGIGDAHRFNERPRNKRWRMLLFIHSGTAHCPIKRAGFVVYYRLAL